MCVCLCVCVCVFDQVVLRCSGSSLTFRWTFVRVVARSLVCVGMFLDAGSAIETAARNSRGSSSTKSSNVDDTVMQQLRANLSETVSSQVVAPMTTSSGGGSSSSSSSSSKSSGGGSGGSTKAIEKDMFLQSMTSMDFGLDPEQLQQLANSLQNAEGGLCFASAQRDPDTVFCLAVIVTPVCVQL